MTKPLTHNEIYWRYTEPNDKTAKMLLLTVGGVLVTGSWHGCLGEFFLAYSPLPKRDKDLEDKLFSTAS